MKLGNASINLDITVYLFVRLSTPPHGLTRIKLEGFSWSLPSEIFLSIRGENLIIRYMLIDSVAIFAAIMNEISEQHLRASSFCTCSKVRICTGCSIYLDCWIQLTAKFVLHIEVLLISALHRCPKTYLFCFALQSSKPVYFLFKPVQHGADINIYIILH